MANIKTLCYKNSLIFRTNYKKYILLYISPLLVLLLLIMLQNWANKTINWEDRDKPIEKLPIIPKCHGAQCVTIAYKVHGSREPYMDHVINHVMKVNNLQKNDVTEWSMPQSQIMEYLSAHRNKTQLVIVFCSKGQEEIKFGTISIPCYADDFHLNFYTIIYNLTLFHRVPFLSSLHSPYPIDKVTLRLKQDIDEGIIRYYFQDDLEYNMTVSQFPATSSRFVRDMNVTSQYGSFFFMIPFLVLLVMEASHMLKQKQNRLRIGLNIVGVSHFQFYFSQIITYLFHVLVISVNYCIFGYILDFKFFSNAILWFAFLVLVTNGIIVGLLAFCITAAVSERSLGMSIIYGFVLYSIVMQWLFTGGFVFEFLYFAQANWIIILIRYIFNCYPSYHFSKIFTDVSKKADSHFDTWNNAYVNGTVFDYNSLFEGRTRTFQFPTRKTYLIPSTIQTYVIMLSTSFLYLMALYLLDILVESNRGYRQPIFQRNRKNSLYEHQEPHVIKVTNLQKTYKNKTFALKGLSFTMSEGETIGLLGQNGAGKSTLINIIIGALTATQGRACVDGHSVDEDMNQVRKILGVCPQFDILWQELTALQHMYIFSKLKKLESIQPMMESGLKEVHLWDNRNGRVSTFSGGMKRRLSLAISLLGNPKLIVLDEPTTGMDVKIRLETWKIILALKSKTSILLTTHNMDEAECLSDRILILNKGRLVAEGTSQQLKKSFGKGYVIKGLNPHTKENVVWRCTEEQLESQLDRIEKEGLENWSLKETTLEEVFLNAINMF